MAILNSVVDWVFREGRDGYHLRMIRAALAALGEGVRNGSARIDEAQRAGYGDYAEAVTDEECDVIETLLGSAFTVCQTHIARVVADVKVLHGFAQNQGATLTTTTDQKQDIMRRGCEFVGNTGVSGPQAIDALANYFKHRDEWSADWNNLGGNQQRTQQTISALGLKSGSSGNLRSGAESLGIAQYEHLDQLAEILAVWHANVIGDYDRELRSKGLRS